MRRPMNRFAWPLLLLMVPFLFQGGTSTAERPLPDVSCSKRPYAGIIDRAAKRYGVESALIHALIKVESNYNPKAVSRAGALGLMQLMPETAAGYGVESREALLDPATNIDVGTRHLKRLLKKYKNISRALTAYNAGEGRIGGFRKSGAYIETRKFTVRVIKYYQQYKGRK